MAKCLHEQIIKDDGQGKCQIVKQWLSGWHPEEGRLIIGWTGRETEVEKRVVRPTVIYIVEE